jgi:hypothetical protein
VGVNLSRAACAALVHQVIPESGVPRAGARATRTVFVPYVATIFDDQVKL